MDIYQERLKSAREKLGLSQVAISNLLGMKPQQWYKYESGISKMSLDTLKQFCETLHISADYILGLHDELNWNNTAHLFIEKDKNGNMSYKLIKE